MGIGKKVIASATLALVAGVMVVTTAPGCSAKEKTGASAPVVQTQTAAPAAPQSTPEPAAAAASQEQPKKQLLFFMNPYGRPCQMQDAIIHELGDAVTAHATVRYYKTSEPADRQAFGEYGIRGLPSLIILDDKGKELRRFTPGVQEGSTIIDALR